MVILEQITSPDNYRDRKGPGRNGIRFEKYELFFIMEMQKFSTSDGDLEMEV
ncbi:hypothetical protein [Subsaximicrobium wynnwilliamsii]|uniref:hypothetical protein n=1 Tax=Subsaximicrobium wynnwilliamsii TaxID=291179 RepID=UPI001673B97A|nr:hypothetical protein [Subsaximicrobium wynnwilliamsii]